MLVGLISGFFVMVVGVVCTPAILRLMDTPDDVLPLAILYLRIYFLGMPGSMLYNFGAAVLRGVGDTRRPLIFLFFAGIVNVAVYLRRAGAVVHAENRRLLPHRPQGAAHPPG